MAGLSGERDRRDGAGADASGDADVDGASDGGGDGGGASAGDGGDTVYGSAPRRGQCPLAQSAQQPN